MADIKIKTPIPGPKSLELMKARESIISHGVFKVSPIFVSKAKGSCLEDVDGNTFLDFSSGIGVVNFGHRPDPILNAIQEQSSQFLHTCFNVAPYENALTLAKKLCQITPGSFAKKVFFANSGAEAVENAIKIARVHTKRQAIVCFEHGFHGRTYMAMSLTSKVKPYRYGFDPFCPEVYRAPFPYPYRAKSGDAESTANECFAKFEEMVNLQIASEKIAAIIIEPVLGEGGFLPAPFSFLKKLRDFCTQNGIVFIADEIQTGFGRTGSLFACEQSKIEPDLITLAKGMGGGLPISAVVGKSDIMDSPIEGSIGGTYGGNPLSCATALATIEMLEDGSILKNAQALGDHLKSRLNSWKDKFEIVGDVRGLGPMQAVEIVKSKKSKEPNKEACGKIAKHSVEKGVILLTAGSFGNAIRFLMPLTTTISQLNEGLDVVEAAIQSLN